MNDTAALKYQYHAPVPESATWPLRVAREPPWVVVVEVAKRLQDKQAALGKEIHLAAKYNLSKYYFTRSPMGAGSGF